MGLLLALEATLFRRAHGLVIDSWVDWTDTLSASLGSAHAKHLSWTPKEQAIPQCSKWLCPTEERFCLG